ncbi:MAG: agmatine deiminase family protein [Pseudomonadota bacterium]
MINRRTMLGGIAATALSGGPATRAEEATHLLPEWHPHERCVMTWCDNEAVYGAASVAQIRVEQACIAKAIAKFEPVTMLANSHEIGRAKKMCGPRVTVREIAVDDIWARDTMPIIQARGRKDAADRPVVEALGWNFNAWGEKYPGLYLADRTLAQRYAQEEALPFIRAPIIAEGGAMETDGIGTLITTETCLLNENRNPGMSRADVEEALKEHALCDHVIWLWGSEADYVTDGHVDGVCRIIRPGLAIAEVTDDKEDPEYSDLQENAVRLEAARDARGEKLEVIRLNRPRWEEMPERGPDFSASYVNSYFPNRGIVMPKFGDGVRDRAARRLFEELEPKRKVVQIAIDEIAEGGGGIHCCTMQIPAPVPEASDG